MGAGRFLCVALPFGLTLASMICILMAMLAGITNKSLDMFELNTTNLSISSSSLESLVDLTKRDPHFSDTLTTALNNAAAKASSGQNITAADLDLADKYQVFLWNYCAVNGTNVTCSKAQFNWASTTLNSTDLNAVATTAAGVSVSLPTKIQTALKTFAVVLKWTEVVYIIAILATAAELGLGFFAMCSRAGSCCTFIVSGFSTVAITLASIMATATSATVVGSLNSIAKSYGVKASLDTSFLTTTWLAVIFSIAGGIFWMTTICCCAADHSSRKASSGGMFGRRNRGGDAEKIVPTGAYQRVQDPDTAYHGQQYGIYNPQASGANQEYGVPMQNVRPHKNQQGYEPYSHTQI